MANETSNSYQQIKVKNYTVLIDSGLAWCNVSVYMGCSQTNPHSQVNVTVRFINSQNLSMSYQSLSKQYFDAIYIISIVRSLRSDAQPRETIPLSH